MQDTACQTNNGSITNCVKKNKLIQLNGLYKPDYARHDTKNNPNTIWIHEYIKNKFFVYTNVSKFI